MREHGSISLYVHGNPKARYNGEPRTATSTLTQLPDSVGTMLLSVHRSEGAYWGRGRGWGGVGGDERVKDRPRIPPEKYRRDRGPPPEQWKC